MIFIAIFIIVIFLAMLANLLFYINSPSIKLYNTSNDDILSAKFEVRNLLK